jgi:hypothetical protein
MCAFMSAEKERDWFVKVNQALCMASVPSLVDEEADSGMRVRGRAALLHPVMYCVDVRVRACSAGDRGVSAAPRLLGCGRRLCKWRQVCRPRHPRHMALLVVARSPSRTTDGGDKSCAHSVARSSWPSSFVMQGRGHWAAAGDPQRHLRQR